MAARASLFNIVQCFPIAAPVRRPLSAILLSAAFESGRDFLALVGGKDKLGSISKQGDRYLRSLFAAGAQAVIRYAEIHGTWHRPWLTLLLARRPAKASAIALANRLARMAWAMMARNEVTMNPLLSRGVMRRDYTGHPV